MGYNSSRLLVFTIVLALLLVVAGSLTAATAANVKINEINHANIKNVGINNGVQDEPDISGNIVVYVASKYPGTPYWDYASPVSSEIYWKHIKTGSSARVSAQYGNLQFNPAISGTRVVWEQHIGSRSYIYIKNLATGLSSKVYTSTKNQYNPDISGTRVVWEEEQSSGNNIIYTKNLATGSTGRITNSIYDQNKASISGTRVVWTEQTSSGHSYVYVKNLLTGASVRLGNNEAGNPDISGNKVVWAEERSTEYSDGNYLCWRDLVKGAGGTLYHNQWSYLPKISGSRVVWLNDYYTEATNELIRVYVKNIVTGSLVTVNLQHSGGQFSYTAAISGVNVVWYELIRPHPTFLVYWKNVLTGTGGGM